MTGRKTHKLIIFNFIMLIFLTLVGCNEPEFTDFVPIENLRVPYDYEEAAEKLVKFTRTFPTSFGSDYDNIYIYDVTGDGVDDLGTFVFFGSGMPRMDVVVYAAARDDYYTLDGLNFRGAYGYNYRILSVEDYGVVILEKQFYPEEHIPKYGLLKYENGELGMDEFDRKSPEYEHAKEIYEEIHSEGISIW